MREMVRQVEAAFGIAKSRAHHANHRGDACRAITLEQCARRDDEIAEPCPGLHLELAQHRPGLVAAPMLSSSSGGQVGRVDMNLSSSLPRETGDGAEAPVGRE